MAANKEYSFDETFNSGLNFVASDDNTKGKSSVLIAIYYCLGFEEIIGGVNEKVLTSAYKTMIEDDKNIWPVLESGVFLEVSNGVEEITIYRSAKSDTRDSKLVTVYFSKLTDMYAEHTNIDEFYVHMPNAANNIKGFHNFLEKYIGIELPLVPANDGVDRKLYLQLVFAAMFIEQKNGWSGIYSGMPYLAIKDSKRRVTEFILGLSTFENERKRNAIVNKERYQKEQWRSLYNEMVSLQNRNQCIVKNVPLSPEILSKDFAENVHIVRNVGESVSIDEWIIELQMEHDSLKTIKPRVVDNYDELEEELEEVEMVLSENHDKERDLQAEIGVEKRAILELKSNLEIIKHDIMNNKDALRLKKLGSNLQCKSFEGICPTCNQKIQDSLLPIQHQSNVMTIEQTINHLTAQKEMLEFALEYHRNRSAKLDSALQDIRSKTMTLFRLAKTIRGDLYSVDEDLSETIIYKRMSIEHHIADLNEFKESIKEIVNKFIGLSEKWHELLQEKEMLSQKRFAESDEETIKIFENNFVANLKDFKYTSISNIGAIEISRDNYMPVIDKFDMKFDSSASDNIRAIWSYTLALLQTSKKQIGNHPGVLIFDEPTQHSIGAEDANAFFKSIIALGDKCQVIVGITVNNADIKNVISNFQTCRAACPPYVVPAFRHKQCMNPASLQFRLSLSRAILSMRISVHYRARRGEWRKTILSRKLICAVILFKHKQLRPRVRTLII